MTFLKEKGEFNKSSADLLYKNSYYASSVHCAYYSCFQLLKYIIKVRLKIDYNQQETEIGANRRLNSHSYVTKKILDEINLHEKDVNTFREVRTKLKDLQELRVKSDYRNLQIDESKGRMANQYSDELRKYFKEKLL